MERDIEILQQQLRDLKVQPDETRQQQIQETRIQEIAKGEIEADRKHMEKADGVDIGGALRFNYAYRDYSDSSETKGGDLEFDIFRLNVDGAYKDVLISAEYRL